MGLESEVTESDDLELTDICDHLDSYPCEISPEFSSYLRCSDCSAVYPDRNTYNAS